MKCDHPITHKLKRPIITASGAIYTVPLKCGKCLPCIQSRTQQWAFRIEQELKRCTSAYFVTLTYDTSNVPFKHGRMTLDKSDAQKFVKRLREHQRSRFERNEIVPEDIILSSYGIDPQKAKIRYYLVGEYGSLRGRPHLHAIIFNATKRDILKSWKLGNVHIDSVNSATIFYTLKYMEKAVNEKTKRTSVVKEFNIQSKDLGQNYLTENVVRFYKGRLDINYLTGKLGEKIPMPKYYRDKILSDDEKRLQIPIIKESAESNQVDLEKKINRLGMNYFSYLNGVKRSHNNILNKPSNRYAD